MPIFSPLTAHFGGLEGFINDKSAILCPGKTEVADLVSFKGSIVQGINSYFTIDLYIERVLEVVYNDEFVQYKPIDWSTNTVFLRNIVTDRKHSIGVEDFTNKKIKF